MILTEEEARKKWCPHARELGRAQDGGNISRLVAGYNRGGDGAMIPSCIGSACMAWRWAEAKKIRDIDLVTSDVVDLPPRVGFCGLSGTPDYGD